MIISRPSRITIAFGESIVFIAPFLNKPQSCIARDYQPDCHRIDPISKRNRDAGCDEQNEDQKA